MIFVFSGTGNSAYTANALSDIANEKVYSINNIMHNDNFPELDISDENLIVVCPTYAWRCPKIVDDFILENNFAGVKKIWFVMTCGAEIGNAPKYNKETAKCAGFQYMGTIGIRFPDNYIIMFQDEKPEEAKRKVEEARVKIEEIGKVLSKHESFEIPPVNARDRLMSSIVNPLFNLSVKADKFKSDDKCISCGKCEKLCPLNNIKIVDFKPSWGKKCINCMSCISYCPTGAIEYGTKTVGKRKYTFESYQQI